MSLNTIFEQKDLDAQPAHAAFKRSRMIALVTALMLSMTVVACGDDDTPQDNNAAAENNDNPDAGDKDSDSESDDPDGEGDVPDGENDDPDGEDVDPSGIEITGVYDNDFGGVETITDTLWETSSEGYPTQVAKIDSFDNTENFAITQNAADAEYSPDAFNKIVWTEPDADGEFFYCTVDFGLDTAEEASQTAEVADDSSPEDSGCGGFAWTKLSPHVEVISIEIAGVYDSNFGGVETITDATWVTDSDEYAAFSMRIDSFDNTENTAITQNIADENYDSEEFTKIVWTEPDSDGVFYYCYVDFGLNTAEEAAQSTEVADDSNPEEDGCSGFPWTKLSPHAGS